MKSVIQRINSAESCGGSFPAGVNAVGLQRETNVFLCLRPSPIFSCCVSVRPSVLKYLKNRWTEFHQTLVNGAVQLRPQILFRFCRSLVQGQGRYKVRCEKFRQPCTYTHEQHERFRPNLMQTFYTTVRWNDCVFEGHEFKVKVTTRSNILASYYGGRRHPHRCLGVDMSSSFTYKLVLLPELKGSHNCIADISPCQYCHSCRQYGTNMHTRWSASSVAVATNSFAWSWIRYNHGFQLRVG